MSKNLGISHVETYDVFAYIVFKLVSHWHANISRDCFANFVADFRTTFVRVSHECRENFHVSRTSREGFKHV